MIVIPVKGTIVSSSNKWIYDWIGIQATCPEDVEKLLIKAKSNNEDVVVEINSGGGEVFAGFEIYTLIRQYEGNKEIHIVGLAGSAASVIAMSAVCKISPVGMIMIHNSSTYTEGDYREMDISSGMLQAINSSIRLAYLQKSKVDEKALIELMDNETWMNARDAIANGFADSMLFEDEEVFTPVASVKDIVLSASTLNKIKKLKAENKTDDFNLKINGFSSKKMKTQYGSASKLWTAGQTTAILAVLASADMSIRSGGNLMEDVLLQKLIYEIVVKKGATSAVYDFALD